MKLSELKTGDKAVVVKVSGHGGFRKRIVEMGFIKGKVVEVLLNAPLRDPVKYKLMGYEISLRRDEAEMIEVISEDEARNAEQQTGDNIRRLRPEGTDCRIDLADRCITVSGSDCAVKGTVRISDSTSTAAIARAIIFLADSEVVAAEITL